jgi:hypothetical protein
MRDIGSGQHCGKRQWGSGTPRNYPSSWGRRQSTLCKSKSLTWLAMLPLLCCAIIILPWQDASKIETDRGIVHVAMQDLKNISVFGSSHAHSSMPGTGRQGDKEQAPLGVAVVSPRSEARAEDETSRRMTRMVFAGTPSTVDKHDLESNRECQRSTWGSKMEHFVFLNQSDLAEELHPGNWKLMKILLQRAIALGNWEWLIKGDELTYILPHNMRNYLSGLDSSLPVILGNTLSRGQGRAPFASGGSGIVMSRAAVEMLLNGTCDSEAKEHPEEAQFMSDVLIGEHCYGSLIGRPGAFLPDTRAPDGEIFNVYGPVRSTRGELDDWYIKYKSNHGQAPVKGAACCSSKSVSFYYVDHHECEAMWKMGQNFERWRAMDHDERLQEWPERVSGCDAFPFLSILTLLTLPMTRKKENP